MRGEFWIRGGLKKDNGVMMWYKLKSFEGIYFYWWIIVLVVFDMRYWLVGLMVRMVDFDLKWWILI